MSRHVRFLRYLNSRPGAGLLRPPVRAVRAICWSGDLCESHGAVPRHRIIRALIEEYGYSECHLALSKKPIGTKTPASIVRGKSAVNIRVFTNSVHYDFNDNDWLCSILTKALCRCLDSVQTGQSACQSAAKKPLRSKIDGIWRWQNEDCGSGRRNRTVTSSRLDGR